eukprot:2437515-Lingulodinium_polyedra.AAC.1
MSLRTWQRYLREFSDDRGNSWIVIDERGGSLYVGCSICQAAQLSGPWAETDVRLTPTANHRHRFLKHAATAKHGLAAKKIEWKALNSKSPLEIEEPIDAPP